MREREIERKKESERVIDEDGLKEIGTERGRYKDRMRKIYI